MAEPVTDTEVDSGRSKPTAIVAKYWREISRYEKAAESWETTGDKIVKRYLDEDRGTGTRRFAILWSNIATLQPAVYGKQPQVIVGRRHRDPDPKARVATELLERATNTTFDLYAVDDVLKLVRDDRLLAGRGQAWVRYESTTEKAKDDAGADYDRVIYEKVCCDYVHWRDFGHNLARVWADAWLVWRKVYKTRKEVSDRWGKEKSKQLSYTSKDPSDKEDSQTANKACIYELWDKKDGKCVWLAKDAKGELEVGDPPLQLTNFFPCPKPVYATLASKSLFPTPDFRYYQDQANEVDALTEKIDGLTKWLIVKGFVPAGVSSEGPAALQVMLNALQSNLENASGIFVPVESWAGFQERGGAGKMIDWLPIKEIIETLQAARETRAQLIEDIYQETGISDILRGQTDPNETLGAQELKAQTGSRRVKTLKDDMARFAKDLANIVAEVIADLFQPTTLEAMTGLKYVPAPTMPPLLAPPMPNGAGGVPGLPAAPPDGAPTPLIPQQGPEGGPQQPPPRSFDDQVMALLRDDGLRNFRIEIETDSTVQPDEDAEKQRRIEFATMLGEMLEKSAGIMQIAPQLAPMLAEGLKFVVRGFRAGREMEEVVEKTLEQIGSAPQGQQGPSPEEIKAQLDMKLKEMDLQGKAQDQQHQERMRQIDIAEKQQEAQVAQTEREMKVREISEQIHHAQTMRNHEVQRSQDEFAAASAKHQDDREKADMEKEGMAAKHDFEQQHHAREMHSQAAKHAFEKQSHAHKIEQETGNVSLSQEGEKPVKITDAMLQIAEALKAQKDAIAEMGDVAKVVEGLMHSHQEMIKAHKSPKRIIRDQSGRAVGVETL